MLLWKRTDSYLSWINEGIVDMQDDQVHRQRTSLIRTPKFTDERVGANFAVHKHWSLLCCHPAPTLLMGFQGQHVIPNAQIRSLMKFCSKKKGQFAGIPIVTVGTFQLDPVFD